MTELPTAAPARLPMSFAQEQLWFIDEFHNGLPAHNVAVLAQLRGPLDLAALGRALDQLAARHAALRTRLLAAPDGQPIQVVDPPAPVKLELTDLSAAAPGARAALLRDRAAAQALEPFRLSAGRLLRVHLYRLSGDEHGLLLVTHKTVADETSARLAVADLAGLYGSEVTGSAPAPAPAVEFAGYVRGQREQLTGARLTALETYWQTALADFETSQFPPDRPRPVFASHEGAVQHHVLSPELLTGLTSLSQRAGTTLDVTLLAAVAVLLHRYTGQSDVVLGLASPARADPGLAPVIGFLANTLPVRTDLSGNPAFGTALDQVRAATDGARAHEELPFARIVEALRVPRDTGRFPIVQVALSCAEPAAEVEAAGVTFAVTPVDLRAAMYDLAFAAEPGPDGLSLTITYTPALFNEDTVVRLLGHLEVLLAGAVANPAARLSELPVLTPAERQRELVEWNDTTVPFPAVCIHQGFEARVRDDASAVAAEFGTQRWTYGELNEAANRVARRLRDLGVGPESLVGVAMDVSLRRLAVLLGVWKAGGGYVPLDPELPAERLEFVIGDTAMAVVVADAASAAQVPAPDGVSVVDVDGQWDELAGLDGSDLAGTGAVPSDVAYVIYTSGSTGRPKGVLVEHRQALTFLQGMVRAWQIEPGGAVLSFAAFTFDVSVMDMFMPLLAGARVVLAPPEVLHSPPRLAELIRSAGVTFCCLPPAVLSLLTGERFGGLRTLLSAGEELSSELLRSWLRDGTAVYNGYGPTEASIGAVFMRLDESVPLPPPIGRPKPNYRAYVLDGYLNPVPVGVTGELHIGGSGVTRGYLRRPGLTSERFIADPFGRPGGRLYKTGDLVRRRVDGTIEFAGRADNQVKIRGLRVELGEIETALAECTGVAQAVVIVITDEAGERQLAGYVRPEPGAVIEAPEIRQAIGQRLPAYMVPGSLTAVAEFPLTSHGKIDKAALPLPQAGRSAERVPPRTLLETALVDFYSGVLGHERAGATDSFFDAGGNSLQAMRLITELRSSLAVDLDITAVFLAPTPRELAGLLRDKHGFDDADLSEESLDSLPPSSDQA
jgi:amino acid adenylation domain-containing protein